ncbi:MAG: PQQ-dependent sugar dehydrogenase [Anaerolineae bacterium]|jgi:glucose/arabinose dehydrogenase
MVEKRWTILLLLTVVALALVGLAAQAQTPTPAVTETPAEVTPEVAETPAEATPEVAETPAAPEAKPTGFSVAPVATPGGILPGNPQVQLVKVADGFLDPVNVVSPPDGSGRLFVVERSGTIRVVQDGQLLDTPFLDLTEDTLSAFLEQGLYDIEFHPDFANNGLFYVHFAELLRNGDGMIVEFRVSEADPNVADMESARVILQIEQPFANHNGGELVFGPDGYLYIGSGDGGWEGDPLGAGQDLTTLLGKILRIDVNLEGGFHPYFIPEDNPFAEQTRLVALFGIPEGEFAAIHTGARPEIWAYGLRNSWKFHFDSQTGDLYHPDVGQNHWEEINFQPADSPGGENYGWDFLMGSYCHPIETESCTQVGVLPVAQYSHDLGCAAMGLGVYRGGQIPGLDGVYLVGDFCSGRLFGLARDEAGEWQFQELLHLGVRFTGGNPAQDGNIYVTTCNCDYGGPGPLENPPGSLWMIVAADQVPEGAETAPLAEGE